MTRAKSFREAMKRGMVSAPGCYDCITARSIERAGFEEVYMTGAGTGYGNELNAIRTVREYEKRGVAGLHIEDQGFPKKCGHLEDKVIAPIDDYVAKIRAAVSAKVDPDFLVET